MPQVKKNKTYYSILGHARTLFAQQGYHETSVSHIITAVGMSQGTFYTYFENKKSIFEIILRDFTLEIKNTLEKIPLHEVKDKISYMLLVYRLGEMLMEVFFHNKNLTRIFFWEAVGIDKNLDAILDESYIDITNYCERYLKIGQEVGVIRQNINTQLVASATIGMCTHMLNRYLRNDFELKNKNEIIETIFDLQLNGILCNLEK